MRLSTPFSWISSLVSGVAKVVLEVNCVPPVVE
jgi:hypothetical protein